MCRFKLIMLRNLLLIVLFVYPLMMIAQPESVPLKLGISLVGFSYSGDLIEEGDQFRRFYPGSNFSIQFNGKKSLQLQVNTGFGRFTEQADFPIIPTNTEVIPNDFVETSLFYIDLRAKYWFLKEQSIRPFIGFGLGMLFFNPKDAAGNFLGENIFTRLEDEEYSTTVVNFPLTIGAEMSITQNISLGLDYTYRITPTDYLDNIGKLGAKKGNDALHAIQLGLFFTLKPSTTEIKPAPKTEIQPKLELVLTPIKPHSIPSAGMEIPLILEYITPDDQELRKSVEDSVAKDLLKIIPLIKKEEK